MQTLSLLLGYLIGGFFHLWAYVLGRSFTPDSDPWLAGPVGVGSRVGFDVYDEVARREGLTISTPPDAGIIENLEVLRGPAFDPDQVDARVRHFYEHTDNYGLEAWSKWSLPFQPLAWVLMAFVSRRMNQLNLPVSSLDLSEGMRSRVLYLGEASGRVIYRGWFRTMARSGAVVYAGLYSVAQPPMGGGPCVRCCFPVPRGNATVLLRPRAGADGSLTLHSHGRGFGDAGYYRVAAVDGTRRRGRFIRALQESIHVFVDDAGTLRTNHEFKLFEFPILTLHYKITAKC
jgi:hypothetical protein